MSSYLRGKLGVIVSLLLGIKSHILRVITSFTASHVTVDGDFTPCIWPGSTVSAISVPYALTNLSPELVLFSFFRDE